MTKKHFIKLAKALKENRPELSYTLERERWERIREAIIEIALGENPRFDRARFIRATEE